MHYGSWWLYTNNMSHFFSNCCCFFLYIILATNLTKLFWISFHISHEISFILLLWLKIWQKYILVLKPNIQLNFKSHLFLHVSRQNIWRLVMRQTNEIYLIDVLSFLHLCPSFYICKIAVGSVLLSKLKIFIGFFYTFVVSLQKTFINPLELEHQLSPI